MEGKVEPGRFSGILCKTPLQGLVMPPIGYPGNSITKEARAKAGGGFESAIENAAPAAQRVISGTGFGGGPNVVLFDSMSSGTDGADVDFANGPEIGSWAGDLKVGDPFGSIAGAKYYAYNGRLWLAGREPSRLSEDVEARQGLTFVHDTQFTEFRLSFRTVIPTGFYMPGSTLPNTVNNTGSDWKLTWLGIPENGYGPDNQGPDVCIPTLGGSNNTVFVQGNTISPEKNGDNSLVYTSLSGTSENFFSWYQKPGSGQLTNDGVIELISGKDSGVSVQKDTTANPFAFNATNPTPLAYRNILFNALANKGRATWADILSLWGDMYVALGDNSYAHIITGDAPTLAACTKQHEIPPDSWSDTQIAFTPPPWAGAYTHIWLADGTLIENAEGV